jgi:hypothetical protein
VQYLGANVPQAWAAGSCFSLVLAMTGFQPDAPAGMLYLDPALPEWMPDLRLRSLRDGGRSFDIQFTRKGDATTWEVIRGDKSVVAYRSVEVLKEGSSGLASPPSEEAETSVSSARS